MRHNQQGGPVNKEGVQEAKIMIEFQSKPHLSTTTGKSFPTAVCPTGSVVPAVEEPFMAMGVWWLGSKRFCLRRKRKWTRPSKTSPVTGGGDARGKDKILPKKSSGFFGTIQTLLSLQTLLDSPNIILLRSIPWLIDQKGRGSFSKKKKALNPHDIQTSHSLPKGGLGTKGSMQRLTLPSIMGTWVQTSYPPAYQHRFPLKFQHRNKETKK